MTQRAFGIPRTRGVLRIYRSGVLVDEISKTVATKQAAEVVRKTQGRGKPGRAM